MLTNDISSPKTTMHLSDGHFLMIDSVNWPKSLDLTTETKLTCDKRPLADIYRLIFAAPALARCDIGIRFS